jgi:hypothetical protein
MVCNELDLNKDIDPLYCLNKATTLMEMTKFCKDFQNKYAIYNFATHIVMNPCL